MKRAWRKLLVDAWGTRQVFLAEWHGETGGGGSCVFDRMAPAIYYVVTGLGNAVDWSTFPDPSRKYPYEERTGYEAQRYSPCFRVERTVNGAKVWGTVMRTGLATEWTVGNGIAAASVRWFVAATGRALVKLRGKGSQLTGTVR